MEATPYLTCCVYTYIGIFCGIYMALLRSIDWQTGLSDSKKCISTDIAYFHIFPQKKKNAQYGPNMAQSTKKASAKQPHLFRKTAYIFHNRALLFCKTSQHIPQNNPIYSAKEPTYSTIRLYTCRKSLLYSAKEP